VIGQNGSHTDQAFLHRAMDEIRIVESLNLWSSQDVAEINSRNE
jgi:hypothetical protein